MKRETKRRAGVARRKGYGRTGGKADRCADADDGRALTNAATGEIEWVRLLRNGECTVGIGFFRKKLVHFLASGRAKALIRRVSLRQSVIILRDLARVEQQIQPDVESNSAGWERWLGMLRTELAG